MALGRSASSSTRIPRAIAPLVTTTTSSPAAWRAASSAHTAASTSVRGEPSSWATIEEPSLTTVRAMARASNLPFPVELRGLEPLTFALPARRSSS